MSHLSRFLLLISALFGSISAFSHTPEKWLILGAGTKDDVSEWNSFAKKQGIEWVGFNSEDCVNCIHGDFNKVEDLEAKIEDPTYDRILFDRGTAHFSNWTFNHIQTLYKKLKDEGSLYIMHDIDTENETISLSEYTLVHIPIVLLYSPKMSVSN